MIEGKPASIRIDAAGRLRAAMLSPDGDAPLQDERTLPPEELPAKIKEGADRVAPEFKVKTAKRARIREASLKEVYLLKGTTESLDLSMRLDEQGQLLAASSKERSR